MRITVFTSNQPRHTALIESLATVADCVYAVQECNTVFPGRVADFFRKSQIMQRYFEQVMAAERRIFGDPRFPHGEGIRQLPVKMGDLNGLAAAQLGPALDADLFVVFGASFIKGPLCDLLVARRAINLHMGVSPYYRGSSCNFWALYDRRPELVGATLHLLTKGLDSGPMLLHALPGAAPVEAFDLGMLAVRSAHTALVRHIAAGTLLSLDAVPQDAARQLRYTRNAEFTDAVAAEYLDRQPAAPDIGMKLRNRDETMFLRPFVEGASGLAAVTRSAARSALRAASPGP